MQHKQQIIFECPECGFTTEISIENPPCTCPLCVAMESRSCLCHDCGVEDCQFIDRDECPHGKFEEEN